MLRDSEDGRHFVFFAHLQFQSVFQRQSQLENPNLHPQSHTKPSPHHYQRDVIRPKKKPLYLSRFPIWRQGSNAAARGIDSQLMRFVYRQPLRWRLMLRSAISESPPRTGRGPTERRRLLLLFHMTDCHFNLVGLGPGETEAIQPNEILFRWMTESSAAIVATHTHTHTPGSVLLYLRGCMTVGKRVAES